MASSAVARETFFALRREIARIEGRLVERLETPAQVVGVQAPGLILRRGGQARGEDSWLKTGVEAFDASLGGGVPKAALTEFHGAESRNAGAVAGFALALLGILLKSLGATEPMLWVSVAEFFREAGRPYAIGLSNRFGITPQDLVLAETRRLEDALWLAEEAATLGRFSAILLELPGNPPRLDLTATRRLHRRAAISGRPVFLLRQAAQAEPTAAPIRLLVSPSQAGYRKSYLGPLAGSIGPPAFVVSLSKTPTARNDEFTLEWNADEHRFEQRPARPADHGAVVPAPARAAGAAPAPGEIVAFQSLDTSAAGRQPSRRQRPDDLRAG